jgi:hypothetical protein
MYIIPKRKKKSKSGFPKHPRDMRNYHSDQLQTYMYGDIERREEKKKRRRVLCNEIESKDILLFGLIRHCEKATQAVKRA